MRTGMEFGNHERMIMDQVSAYVEQLERSNFAPRLWGHDQGLWTTPPATGEGWTGWLNAPAQMLEVLPGMMRFCEEVKSAGFTHALLIGMGGSSMAPIVFQRTNTGRNGLALTILDTTDPDTIREVSAQLPLDKTLFIISSKSGSTAEIMALYHYFFGIISARSREQAGKQFIAITDKSSPLSELASAKGFRKTFINLPGIGGRFSALSYFGIVPAALMGVDVKTVLKRAQCMAEACGKDIPAEKNPGIFLGALLAAWNRHKRDKLTYLVSPSLAAFGWWLEQLLAESTGKHGIGILPLDANPLASTRSYGSDRLFFRFCHVQEAALAAEEQLLAEHPWFRINLRDPLDIGAEFFRWEVATATAGALFGIDPFDQPNVEESKKFTRALIREQEEGKVREMGASLESHGLRFFGQKPKTTGKKLLEAFFAVHQPGDYVVLQAYLPEGPGANKLLLEAQHILQEKLKLAVSTQYGPRYLHSTGQYHKGGPDNGFFIQLVNRTTRELPIPGQVTGFGALKWAQALGDHEALAAKGKKVLFVDIGTDVAKGLWAFNQVLHKLSPVSGAIKHMPESGHDPLQAAS